MYNIEKLQQNNEFYDLPYKYDDIVILGYQHNTDKCIIRRNNNIYLVKVRYNLQGYYIVSKNKKYFFVLTNKYRYDNLYLGTEG